MSYSATIKQQLAEKEIKKPCCRRALLFGLLSLRGKQQAGGVSLSVEAGAVAPLALRLIREQLGREAVCRPARGGQALLTFESRAAADYLATCAPYPPAPLACDHCLNFFLRGVFLGAGRMSDYTKLYHLEFSCPAGREGIADCLSEVCGTPPHAARRRSENLLYYKTNGSVGDFFAAIGAENVTYDLINDNITSGYRNDANRRANCETGNIARAVDASMRCLKALRALAAQDKLSLLPEELQETARLRMENPTASLAVLGSKCSPSISKSGINHRLEKILHLAEEILRRA